MSVNKVRSLDELNKLIPITREKKTGWAAAGGFDQKKTPIKMNRLVAFINHYQACNNGATPTVKAMANELDMFESSVRHLLNKLEERGVIYRVATNPLRVMIVRTDVVQTLEQARRIDGAFRGTAMPPGAEDASAKERYEAADAVRMQIGRFIGEMWQKEARGPGIREIMEFTGLKAGHVDTALDILARRRLVKRTPGVAGSLRLTEQGEQTFGIGTGKPAPRANVLSLNGKSPDKKIIIVPGHREPTEPKRRTDMTTDREKMIAEARRREDAALDFIRQELPKTDGYLPSYTAIATAMGVTAGGTVMAALDRLEKQGRLRFLSKRAKGVSPLVEVVDQGKEQADEPKVEATQDTQDRPKQRVHNGKVKRGLPARRKMLAMLDEGIKLYGCPPTAQDIADEFGYTPGGVNHAIRDLKDAGWIDYRPRNLGSMKITERGQRILDAIRKDEPELAETQVHPAPAPEPAADSGTLPTTSSPSAFAWGGIEEVPDSALVMALIDRGYMVTKR